ncbi:MAG: hypothetical protein H0X56_02995, partial [Solirubrobacterales bacterium]|nr:hypothetical protein [Solirubrobacterales bacterium]
LDTISKVAIWALPFEGLYQDALHALTADIDGVTGIAVQLGPFGGAADASAALLLWAVVYAGLAVLAAVRVFARADL